MGPIARVVPNSDAVPGERCFAFLVSTTPCARSIRDHLGSASYSYYFVYEALRPVLERLGTCRLVEHPESRLPYFAARAVEAGLRPIHLAVQPVQDCYLSPAVPNVLFPFWEFPDIPNRDFGYDTRQNWQRICRSASLILTACRFTAGAFRRAGLACPVAVVPIPITPESFRMPSWRRDTRWTTTCRHLELGTEPRIDDTADPGHEPATSGAEPRRGSLRHRAWLAARGGFRRVYPWLAPETVEQITRLKHKLRNVSGHSPAQLAYLGLRGGYRRYVRWWLSDDALRRIARARSAALQSVGLSALDAKPPPRLAPAPLTLSGLVYTSVLNLGDHRKNTLDLLSAFLIAFRDRPDVTLVLKVTTNPLRELAELDVLRKKYESMGLCHRCRVVVITDYLSDSQMSDLMRITTYYVNTSLAEGACLPLMRALAGGRPALAPDHTAMADYMDAQLGFVLPSHREPTYWPHDPELRLETYRYRLVWSKLCESLAASAAVADSEPDRYEQMAAAARRRMALVANQDVSTKALDHALSRLREDASAT